MKKSLLALAVLGAFTGVASAQSSVTLYGTVDVNARYVKNDGSNRRISEGTDGINSSQLVFRAIEDLGGGLKAGMLLNSGINPDTGTANGKFWNRRSTVSLWGNFGEIRLGRDYVPTFWNNTIFDAFGTNGLGDSSTVLQILPTTSASATGNFVRADNSIGYFLPSNLGGAYGQIMVAASEGGAANLGRYIGGRFGFAAGPFDVAAAYAQTRLDLTAGQPKLKTFNIGGSYDLGVVKILGYFDQDKLDLLTGEAKENRFSISGVVPIGQSEIHVGGERSKLTSPGFDNTVSKVALGYVYNLSKRTAVYTTAAYLKNDHPQSSGSGSNSVAGINSTLAGNSQIAPPANPTGSGKSKGIEFGLRHFF